MERRRFLYLTGISGTGLVVLGNSSLQDGDSNGTNGDAIASPVTGEAPPSGNAEGSTSIFLSSVRIVVPAGMAVSLSDLRPVKHPGIGDLRYRVNVDSGASLDVVGAQARIAGPFTKRSQHFQRQAEDGHFPLPEEGSPLHASETILYQTDERRRLGRDSAENTFMYVHRDDGTWTAIHVARADRRELVIDVVDQPLPPAAA